MTLSTLGSSRETLGTHDINNERNKTPAHFENNQSMPQFDRKIGLIDKQRCHNSNLDDTL